MPRARVPSDDAARFGAIIRRLRLARGWQLKDLARASGMHATYLGVLESGGNMPSLQTILQLAELFGVEAADIVREVEQARKAARGGAAV
jgi:transcriptional regulator with XRE-family HTH domain